MKLFRRRICDIDELCERERGREREREQLALSWRAFATDVNIKLPFLRAPLY
jgi:hypothetical protein